MKKPRKKNRTRLRLIIESWNPEDLRRKEKGMKEKKGTGEVERTEESSNQMSHMGWKTKSYEIRNDTKIHRVTGSRQPGDLKRKETDDDNDDETVEREGETEEADEEEEEESEELDERVEEDPEATAPKRWDQKQRKDGSRNYSVGNTRKTREPRKKEKPPNFCAMLSKEEIEEDLRAFKTNNLITRPK